MKRTPYQRLKTLIPDARFLPLTLTIGGLFSGGAPTGHGVAIGAELLADHPGADHSELNAWERAVLMPAHQLPELVVHEYVHTLQRAADERPLLTQVLLEGVAVFLTALALDTPPSGPWFVYGRAHEAELWPRFLADVAAGAEHECWLYQGDAADTEPADLGYYLGYRLAEEVYGRASDKQRAIHELLDARCSLWVLRRAGLSPR